MDIQQLITSDLHTICVSNSDKSFNCVNIFCLHFSYGRVSSEEGEPCKRLNIGITFQLHHEQKEGGLQQLFCVEINHYPKQNKD